ncbi:MAG: hypothetical protein IJQ22_09330 [Bacteroidales bacterium]|nr:hypothetical protein [Bacteroidales bacterium]
MKQRYIFTYLVLLVIQIICGGLLNLSQYVVLCFLPVMILSLPITLNTPGVLVTAFLTGFAVDFFTDGVLGLTICALLPVAFTRNALIRLVFGTELLSRQEDISIHKQGPAKVLLAILLATTLFFLIYIPVDCAGTRSGGFVALRMFLSVALSTPVSFYIAGVLAPREADRWR